MKIPRCDIFWQSIVNPFLTIKDVARFEYSVDSHHDRSSLMMEGNNNHNNNHNMISLSLSLSEEEKGHDPYDDMIGSGYAKYMYHDYFVNLESFSLINWCNKRQVRLVHVKISISYLQHIPINSNYDILSSIKNLILSFESNYNKQHDDLNYCKVITSSSHDRSHPNNNIINNNNNNKSIIFHDHLNQIFQRFVSIKSIKSDNIISSSQSSFTSTQWKSFIHQIQSNKLRQSSSINLESVDIHGSYISNDSLQSLIIENISTIKSLRITSISSINYHDIFKQSHHLTQISLTNCDIHDDDIITLTQSCNRYIMSHVSIISCPNVSIKGIESILSTLSSYIKSFQLHMWHTSLNEDNVTNLLVHCPNLLNLHLISSSYANTTRYIEKIYMSCPLIVSLSLHIITKSVLDYHIEGLIDHCKNMMYLRLYIQPDCLSNDLMSQMALKYRESIKVVDYYSNSDKNDDKLSWFRDCRHRVAVNGMCL